MLKQVMKACWYTTLAVGFLWLFMEYGTPYFKAFVSGSTLQY